MVSQQVASIGAHFVALYPILHPQAGPLPSVWTVGTCSPSCLEEHEATVEDDTQDDVGEEFDICENVVNVICIIVRNVLTRTHVGTRLFI